MRGMKPIEKQIKSWLIFDIIGPKHKLFVPHLLKYDLHLIDDPTVSARMWPAKGLIEINEQLVEDNLENTNLISALIRHELMHFILKHEQVGIKWIAGRYGFNIHHLKKSDYQWLKKKLYEPKFVPGLSIFDDGVPDEEGRVRGYGLASVVNFAGDWELSKYYTKDDIDSITASEGGGMILELDHPEMMKMSYMEILDEISKWIEKYKREAMEIIEGNLEDEKTFIPDEVEKEEKEDY